MHCWLSWSILTLSPRPSLMYKYSGKPYDPQRFSKDKLSEAEVTESAKKMLNVTLEECSQTGLAPYYKKNKLPAVSLALFRMFVIRSFKPFFQLLFTF